MKFEDLPDEIKKLDAKPWPVVRDINYPIIGRIEFILWSEEISCGYLVGISKYEFVIARTAHVNSEGTKIIRGQTEKEFYYFSNLKGFRLELSDRVIDVLEK